MTSVWTARGESSPDVVDEFAGGRIAGRRGLIDLLRRLLVARRAMEGPLPRGNRADRTGSAAASSTVA